MNREFLVRALKSADDVTLGIVVDALVKNNLKRAISALEVNLTLNTNFRYLWTDGIEYSSKLMSHEEAQREFGEEHKYKPLKWSATPYDR